MSLAALVLAPLLACPQLPPEPEEGIRFGRAVCRVPDQNGDQVDEFVATAPFARCQPFRAGMLYLFSGKEGRLIGSFAGPEPYATVGSSVEWVERDDAEGALLIAGSSETAFFLVALDGTLLHRFASAQRPVVALADRDCDGFTDFAVQEADEVIVLSGRTFEPLTELPSPIRGTLIGSPGDLDGDGSGEIVLRDEADPSIARICSSRSDRVDVVLRPPLLAPRPRKEEKDRQWVLSGVGDLDEDGVGELAIGYPFDERVIVFSGASGTALFDRKRRSGEAARFGFSVLGGQSLREAGDEAVSPSLLIGAPDGVFIPSAVIALNLQTGEPVWTIEESNLGNPRWSYLGAALCFLDDRDGDGTKEVLVAGTDVTGPHGALHRAGNLRILSGATGEELWYFGVEDLP